MRKVGPMELVIVLVVVVLIFGPGRIVRLGRDLGSAIREFRPGLTGEGDQDEELAGKKSSKQTAAD